MASCTTPVPGPAALSTRAIHTGQAVPRTESDAHIDQRAVVTDVVVGSLPSRGHIAHYRLFAEKLVALRVERCGEKIAVANEQQVSLTPHRPRAGHSERGCDATGQ